MESGEATFLDLPQTAVMDYLLPYLNPTDLLRLRHVHPVTRDWVATMNNSTVISSIWQKSKKQFVEIDNGRHGVIHLRAMRPPNPLDYSSRFFIKNLRWDSVNDPAFSEFLELYAPRIRHLHIQRYSVCSDPKELEFYNSLVNLTRLEIDLVETESMTCDHLTDVDDYLPSKTFGKVQKLGIGKVTYGIGREHLDRRRYIRNHFFPAFTSIQELKSPKEDFHRTEMVYLRSNPECYSAPFIKIFPFMRIEEFRGNGYKGLTTLKVLDMQSVEEPNVETREFVYLAVAAFKCGVELRNLRSTYHMIPDPDLMSFIARLGELPRNLADVPPRALLIYKATSMLNIVPAMLTYSCPNLKRLSITSCNWCMHSLQNNPILTPEQFRIDWPKLETLELNINSKVMGEFYFDEEDHDSLDQTGVFLKYLFREPNGRSALETLRLSFLLLHDKMPLPTLTFDIAVSCTNLVRLELFGWYEKNESYWPLWESLMKLEELILGKCDGLGDEGFIGPPYRENDKPLFLKLTKLKILVFKGMDSMPGITNLTFIRVFKYLSLTHFEMKCDVPVFNFTIHGIRALLDGPFAKSIEHFPFSKWSLGIRGLKPRDVLELHSKFRSSQMGTLCDPEEHTPGPVCRNCARLSSLAEYHTFDRPDKMASVIVKREFASVYDEFKEPTTIWEFGAGVMRSLSPGRGRKYFATICIVGFVCVLGMGLYMVISHK